MVELINFTKSYSSKKNSSLAVENVNMLCKKGEITGLLGLNGAGKTTILKAVTARHMASSGKVLVEGIDAAENLEEVRNLSGFVEEEPNLPAEFTVAEYLKMTARLHDREKFSLQKKDIQSHFLCQSEFLKELSLEELLPKKIRELSKGQRQRLNFAQALIYNPPLLVLDEPASGLDPAQIFSMHSLVKSLKKDHAIILSTHLMQEVDSLCDTVYILHKGKIIARGSPEEIARQNGCKNLEAAFLKLTGVDEGF